MTKKRFIPSSDKAIYQKYSKKSIQDKIENKLAFQHEFGLIADKRVPLCCISAPLTSDNGAGILEKMIDGMLTLDMQFAILGVGSSKYQALITKIASKHPHKVKIIPQSEENQRKMYAACDTGIILKDNSVFQEELEHYLHYGVIPICSEGSAKKFKITNYRPSTEEGEGFIYSGDSVWEIYAAIVRARETYHFPYDWKHIQKSGMELV